jgi:sulfatase maturation enzyme AslB (radical SAM superfamily)
MLINHVDVTPFETIEIQGGEPLFIKEAKAYYDYAAGFGKKISFLTNGTIMNEEWAKKIAEHSSFVYISLNAATKKTHEKINRGSHWEQVLANIQTLRRWKEKLNTNLKIHGHMTVIRKNLHEIPLFISSLNRFGFDRIDFGYTVGISLYLNLFRGRKERLKNEIQKALQKTQTRNQVDLNRLKQIGLA